MSSGIKPIKVYGKVGPNPPKVALVLEELNVPYEVVEIAFGDVKNPEYTAVNPNGRLPAIQDPNTDLTLWESGAIVEYIIERYDKDHKLSFPPGSNESYLAKQWLFFQTTGQGPYYGQAVFFHRYHSEKLPSAIDRFEKEINRVTGVLEGYLAKQKTTSEGNGPWLVGDKFSYADLSFFPWQYMIAQIISKEAFNPESYPHVKKWMDNMEARASTQKVIVQASGKH